MNLLHDLLIFLTGSDILEDETLWRLKKDRGGQVSKRRTDKERVDWLEARRIHACWRSATGDWSSQIGYGDMYCRKTFRGVVDAEIAAEEKAEKEP